jgi:alpha/beta superfamily hydrolase
MARVTVETFELTTADGLTLEAERARPDGRSRATAVLCHPHPQFGGTMRSVVIGALFEALPPAGVTCLRFNFRGVEGSAGVHDHGAGERLDVEAAIDEAAAGRHGREPLLLVGWSFGADMTLATHDARLAGWLAVAPALRDPERFEPVARDARIKRLVLAQHDEVCPPGPVEEQVASWQSTEVEVIPGASHFFIGRTDRVVAAALAFVEELSGR